MPSVTIRDVAREAGFSVATVSNVLGGGRGHVYPAATYALIRGTAERLGYRPNAAARVLRQNTRTLIGMPVQLTEHPYMSRFLLAVQDELSKNDYDSVFLNVSHLLEKGGGGHFPPLHMLAGLVSVGTELQQEWPEPYAHLQPGIPIVSLQPVSAEVAERVDIVQVDFTDAYTQVCEHLMQLGHKNIAYLSGFDNPVPSAASKNQGWYEAAQKCGLSTKYLIEWKRTTPMLPYQAGMEKDDYIYNLEAQSVVTSVVERLTSFSERITALVCSSDEVSIGVQSFLQSQGWKLPEQLSIVGYDGISFGEFIYPSLTTVAPDYSLMSRAAAKRLLERLSGSPGNKTPGKNVLIKPHLVVRASTGPVRKRPSARIQLSNE